MPIRNSMKFSSTLTLNSTKPLLTSNKFILVQNPIDSAPYIKLKFNGDKIEMKKDMTLAELEAALIKQNEAKKFVNFYSPDGSLISKTSLLRYLLHIPYFVLKLDNQREFNVLSEKSFSLRNEKFTL